MTCQPRRRAVHVWLGRRLRPPALGATIFRASFERGPPRFLNRVGILESYSTKTRQKSAALAFMKKAIKRHGSPERITPDGLRSYGPAMDELASARSRRRDAGPTIGSKTRTCPFDDASGRWPGSGGSAHSRGPLPSTPAFTTTSATNALSSPARLSRNDALQPLQSGKFLAS